MALWKECTLSELGTIVGGATPSTKDEANYENGDIPWITPKDLSTFTGRYIFNGERNITQKGLNSCSAQMLPKNTVLFSSRAPIGYVAIAGCPVCTNQGFKSVVPNEKTDPLFLYYLLKYNKEQIENMGSGTTFKEVSGGTMRNIKVVVPEEKEVQIKIGKILGAIDDKIEANTQINNNLYEQARILFSKFLESSNETQLIKLIDSTGAIIRGQTTKYVEHSTLINLNQKVNKGIYLEKQFYKYLDENIPISPDKFAHKKDILLNSLGQGTLGRVHYWNENTPNIVIDQHITIIRAKEGFTTPEFLYLLLSSDEYYNNFLAAVTGSTGMQMLNISAVRETRIPLVDYIRQAEFSKQVEPMFEKISSNTLENETLTLLRNQLLPKLMSGEIDVSELDI